MDEEQLAATLVRQAFSGNQLQRMEAITPDASARRYYRLFLRQPLLGGGKTVVMMVFDSVACAEIGGGKEINSDLSYVELSTFFLQNGLMVPRLFLDARHLSALLIEDVGSVLLADVVLKSRSMTSVGVSTESLYRQAVDQIVVLQKIPPRSDFFPYQRSFTTELYRKEMQEFVDFILEPCHLPKEEKIQVEQAMDKLALELSKVPTVLVHRDFHSWNLLVDTFRRLRVIDFQDALLGSRCYDIVGLLNDRDIDRAIGKEMYCSLLTYFFEKSGLGAPGIVEYERVLLQRDLKVAGRFAKLVSRGLPAYGAWIPGTLARVGRNLQQISSAKSCLPELQALGDIIAKYVPEVAEGRAVPAWHAGVGT